MKPVALGVAGAAARSVHADLTATCALPELELAARLGRWLPAGWSPSPAGGGRRVKSLRWVFADSLVAIELVKGLPELQGLLSRTRPVELPAMLTGGGGAFAVVERHWWGWLASAGAQWTHTIVVQASHWGATTSTVRYPCRLTQTQIVVAHNDLRVDCSVRFNRMTGLPRGGRRRRDRVLLDTLLERDAGGGS